MYRIIVKNMRISEVQLYKKKVYMASVILPLILSILPLIAGKYGPRSGRLECWIDDTGWQFGALYTWITIGIFWGGYRGIKVIYSLYNTTQKTRSSRGKGAMEGAHGKVIMSTLKEHMVRQVIFCFLYGIFAFTNVSYIIILAIRTHDETPCDISLFYVTNTSLVGAYVSLLFALTRENVENLKRFVRTRFVFFSTLWCCQRNPGAENYFADDPTSSSQKSTRATLAQRVKSIVMGGRGNTEALNKGASNPKLNTGVRRGARKEARGDQNNVSPGGGVIGEEKKDDQSSEQGEKVGITTHLGTKIDVTLGKAIIAPPINCESAFISNACSGSSMPPFDHPQAESIEAMRNAYTARVLTYVLDRIQTLAIDETIAKQFMSEIESQSYSLFDDAIGDDVSESFDLDDALEMAKERFNSYLNKSTDQLSISMSDLSDFEVTTDSTRSRQNSVRSDTNDNNKNGLSTVVEGSELSTISSGKSRKMSVL
jgi:hypothetical protein